MVFSASFHLEPSRGVPSVLCCSRVCISFMTSCLSHAYVTLYCEHTSPLRFHILYGDNVRFVILTSNRTYPDSSKLHLQPNVFFNNTLASPLTGSINVPSGFSQKNVCLENCALPKYDNNRDPDYSTLVTVALCQTSSQTVLVAHDELLLYIVISQC